MGRIEINPYVSSPYEIMSIHVGLSIFYQQFHSSRNSTQLKTEPDDWEQQQPVVQQCPGLCTLII